MRRAADQHADLICFPELAITGYPPEDLVLRPTFVQDNLAALETLAASTAGSSCAVMVGFVDRSDLGLHNAAALIRDGRVQERYHKIQLPNFGVFDEKRYFVPGTAACSIRLASSELGLSVCEDAWHGDAPFDEYARTRPRVVLNINGSPYHHGKGEERLEIARDRARQTGAWFVYVNAVGGQDELVFDGGSMVVSPDGEVVARGGDVRARTWCSSTPGLDDEGASVGRPPGAPPDPGPPVPRRSTERWCWASATTCGRTGSERSSSGCPAASIRRWSPRSPPTRWVPRPSACSRCRPSTRRPRARRTRWRARSRLGVRIDTVPITEVFDAYRRTLADLFAGTEEDVAEENLQARIRGNLLMALSNKFGSMVLATGNKSEYAVGYATLYGDMAGGFAPIKDVPKTLVYEVAAWRNAQGPGEPPIPERIMTKPPTAELRPNQLDTDSLPPYETLDPIVEAYVEDDLDVDAIVARGFDRATVERVARMIDRAEYKRRQAAPGVKITPKAFGRDRRLPITNRYGPTLARSATRAPT